MLILSSVLIVGGIGMSIAMVIVAAVETGSICFLVKLTSANKLTETPLIGTGDTAHKSKPVGIALVFLLFFFSMFYKPSWGATVWIWTTEIFSMNVRGQAVGMASQTQNVANAILQQFFPTFLKNKGFYAFYFFAVSNQPSPSGFLTNTLRV